MPVLSSNRPPSEALRLANRITLIVLSAIGIVFGAWQANHCAAIRFGYAAAYAYAAVVFLAVVLCVVGLLLAIYWRTRWIGAGLVAAGLLGCTSFYGGMALLLRLDRVAWRHEPPLVAFGPDQKAGLVIYFRHGTTDEQIEEFQKQTPSFVSEYLRLPPSQANGHDAVALTFSENARPDQVRWYIEKFERDGRVEKTYRDVAPTAIQP